MPDRIPQMQAEIAALKKEIRIYFIISITIGLLRLVWPMAPGGGTAPPAHQTQSVKIGEHSPVNAPSDHAEFLTVKQAAERTSAGTVRRSRRETRSILTRQKICLKIKDLRTVH